MAQRLRQTIRLIAGWIASHELWFLAIAAPFMLFPMGWLPYLALGVIALTWLCRWISSRKPTVSTGLDGPIMVILLMALAGYSISVEPALSQTRFWSITLGVVVFYGIVNTLKSEKQIWAASSLLAVLTVGIAGISLLGTDWQQTRLIDIPWIYDHLPTLVRGLPNSGVPRASDLIHPRFVGITMGVMVAVFLAPLFFSHYRKLRLLSLIVILVGFVTLLLTQTLAGLAGVLAAILFLLIWRNRWFILAVPLGLAGGVAGLYIAGPTRVLQYLLSVDNPIGIAITLRLDIWSRALAMIRDMPYTGIGLNTFPTILSSFYPGFSLGPEPHAHNLFIQTAIDLGLPGLVAFLWLLISWVYIVWRKYRASENPEYRILLLGLVAGVLAYTSHGFMDAMMLGAKPSVALWILLGIGAAPMRPLKVVNSTVTTKPVYQKYALLASLIIVIPIALAIIYPAPFFMNIGAIKAHRALYAQQATGSLDLSALETAKETLSQVLRDDAGNLSAYELLGRIYAKEGIEPLAMTAFAHRVALDGKDPFLRYFPSKHWLTQLDGSYDPEGEKWDDLVQVYSQWMARFPDRAELYIEVSIAWQCKLNNPEMAASILTMGIEKGAMPSGLLEYYLSLISQGDTSMCLINK